MAPREFPRSSEGRLTAVHRTASIDLAAPPERVFEWVDDLGRYPEWLDIVSRVDPVSDARWDVWLRGRLGRFARSKRLRMSRDAHDPPHSVSFVRAEDDGRKHSSWVLQATVAEVGDGSRLDMELSYSGRLWEPVLGRMLDSEIATARERLAALLAHS